MIIGISGKIGSGKDLSGLIIQALTCQPSCFDNYTELTEEIILQKIWDKPNFEIKKFGYALKQIVAILIGCTVEDLEDREFKNKALGEEWQGWRIEVAVRSSKNGQEYFEPLSKLYLTEDEANEEALDQGFLRYQIMPVILSPRLLLQLIGTECIRTIIHPNTWINALFNHYHPNNMDLINAKNRTNRISPEPIFPNWIITDVRFPNEAKAIKDKSGLLIRINRGIRNTGNHLSETALDNYEKFDSIIENNGSIKDLQFMLKKLLKDENII